MNLVFFVRQVVYGAMFRILYFINKMKIKMEINKIENRMKKIKKTISAYQK